MGGSKGNEGTYTFSKLKGTENYKEWVREMGFALRGAGLISYANGTSVKPKLHTEDEAHPRDGSAPLSEEKIEKREAEVEKWILNDSRTCGKIGKICTKAVQQQLKDS